MKEIKLSILFITFNNQLMLVLLSSTSKLQLESDMIFTLYVYILYVICYMSTSNKVDPGNPK